MHKGILLQLNFQKIKYGYVITELNDGHGHEGEFTKRRTVLQ